MEINKEHYKKLKYDVISFSMDTNLDFIRGNIIKYILRAPYKNGKEDIAKAVDYCNRALIKNYHVSSIKKRYFDKFINDNKLDDIMKNIILKVIKGDFENAKILINLYLL